MRAHQRGVGARAICAASLLVCLSVPSAAAAGAERLTDDGSVLPFPPIPSQSIAAPTLQESTLTPFPVETHLPTSASGSLPERA